MKKVTREQPKTILITACSMLFFEGVNIWYLVHKTRKAILAADAEAAKEKLHEILDPLM